MTTYDRPTPETDAFILQIDDSAIDLGQVRSRLHDMECERDCAREAHARMRTALEWIAKTPVYDAGTDSIRVTAEAALKP
jgi:hypothetical protein